jgi:hypothetical protein
MKYIKYYVSSKEEKSNCVIRSFCKLYNEEYEQVYNDLLEIMKEINKNSYNDIEVFEEYMRRRNTKQIDLNKNIKIKDLKLDNEEYIVFCSDKKDYYHMVPIINNILYDKNEESLNLYTISIYKKLKDNKYQ